jgi:hypothetical protein
VLFAKWSWEGLADGSITVTFRRWVRPQALPGRTYRTPVGRIDVTAVDVVEPEAITDLDARASGYPSAEALRADLRGDAARPIYRVRFHAAEDPDPRAVLQQDDDLDDAARADLDRRLDRLDGASRHGPWTRSFLQLIADHPEVRAGDLYGLVGREELQDFKLDVRKLKALGLTISVPRGYRLSPRGEAYLAGATSRARARASDGPRPARPTR